jgi:serine/threonine-protein kinase
MSLRLAQQAASREQTVKALQRLGRLELPGLALIYDMGYQQGLFFFVREYLEGTSLDQTLAGKTRLSPYEVLAIGIKACRILQQTHKLHLFHCNLKPANIWLLAGGELKITDFFIPGFVETLATAKRLDASRWHYSAPEWLQHGTPASSCDIYAIGMILYELVCGEHPFSKHGELTSLAEFHELALPPVSSRQPQLPSLFASTIDRACDRSLHRRFRSLVEFEAALQASLEQMIQSDPAISKTGMTPSSFSFRRMLKAKHE